MNRKFRPGDQELSTVWSVTKEAGFDRGYSDGLINHRYRVIFFVVFFVAVPVPV
jgi:hypothetical protein